MQTPDHITPDESDPEWANVTHNTRTIDCMGGEHGACFLPLDCRCGCHKEMSQEAIDELRRRLTGRGEP